MIGPALKYGVFFIFFCLSGILIISNNGCESQNEEDLFGETDCDTAVVTYSGTIEPILSANCYECHSPPLIAPFSLVGYENVVIFAKNGKLLDAVNHSGNIRMPKGRDQLPDCELAKINKWVNEGANNN